MNNVEKVLEFRSVRRKKFIPPERICNTCNITKPIAKFQRVFKKNGEPSTSIKCNECFLDAERIRQKKIWKNNPEYRERHNAKGKEYRKINPDKRGCDWASRPDKVLKRYGVTWNFVIQTLSNQFGRCANHGCSKEITLDVKGIQKNRAVIDHDHKTGKFRAILCVDCNFLLGQLETKGEKVLGLMDYMNKHN